MADIGLTNIIRLASQSDNDPWLTLLSLIMEGILRSWMGIHFNVVMQGGR